ncbi:MAG: adenylosuccinate lyase, partial [Chloroflexi bacterium]|nr:adenylosuccinate lyase [Chloroflexota bacterium]
MIPRYTTPEMAAVWSPERKFATWLAVEIAACEAWAEAGVVPADALPAIRRATFDVQKIEEYEAETQHDVTAFLRSVGDSIGSAARWVHLGLTSSDVVDTALALQMREAGDVLLAELAKLEEVVADLARQHRYTLMVGRTHGVHAEPVTFGLKLLVWLAELRRQEGRLREARDQAAVGKLGGAVGTHATLPPEVEEAVCRRLGLGVEPVATQIVQRDRHAHVVQALALLGASLEKMATEIRALQRTEVREVEEPFSEGQTGSSAMPHKRNPVLSERVCGLARLLRGHAVTALENVALWHERDISHSSAERVILPDAFTAAHYITRLMVRIVRGLRIYPERMRRNLELTRGLVFSQRVLLALIERGLDRETAYRLVQRNAMRAWEAETSFRDLLAADPEVRGHLCDAKLEELFDYGYFLRYV